MIIGKHSGEVVPDSCEKCGVIKLRPWIKVISKSPGQRLDTVSGNATFNKNLRGIIMFKIN